MSALSLQPTSIALKTPASTDAPAIKGLQDESELNEVQHEKFIICRQCAHQITKPTFAIRINNSHEHSFFNPYGHIFQLKCFSHVYGCLVEGTPSFEFTWFSGHSWQIALCEKCFSHLGWKFTSDSNSFFGLIKNKIIIP